MLLSFAYLTQLWSLVTALGWAGWSPWTPCSRTCGGGVSQQLRRCLDIKCSGHSVRYRVCNEKECGTLQRTSRETVCGGEEIISKQQCEVVCKSRTTGSHFLWRVADGVPCHAESHRAVCSHGTCQIVGCDDVIGSSLRFDVCGVCGGRGDTCDSAQFVWKESGEFTQCPKSCDEAARDYHEGKEDEIHESRAIIVCVNANTGRVVPERLCADRKRPPITEGICLNEPCGHWVTGGWTKCSASCGQGIRRRTAECIGGKDCPFTSRPITEAPCYSGIPCPDQMQNPQPWGQLDNSIDWNDRKFLDESSYSNPSETNGHSPRLILSSWSECSTTCGPGVQTRTAECMAAHPMAGMIRLPYSECQSQQQPSLFEPCEARPCPLQEDPKTNHDETPFRWENGDWGPCSASCLGGKQKAALLCREVATGRTVPWSQCDARTRPPQLVRQCNQHACPPVWQVGPFGPCSVSCGGGTATRSVSCVRPVSRSGGADAHIVLRDIECNLPKPLDTEACSVVACPASWIIGEWSECSASCGSGEQRRAVMCEGRDARGRRERRAENECPADKPPSVQMCSLGSCGKPQLLSNRVFEQNASEKKLTLGIGGVATLYQGTSIKIKCPRKNFDKKKIYWTKNGKRIRNDAHIKVSANGNLRLFHARMEDAGLYECYTDSLQGNVTLRFKYRDDDKPHRPRLSDLTKSLKGHGKNHNASLFEAILSAGSYAEVARELQKHRDIIRARWEIGHWTDCKQSTCGVAGYQAREVTCSVMVDGARKTGDERLCTALASVRPPETRPCHREECPKWDASEWTACKSAPCVREGTAKQRRDVRCLMQNGEAVDEERCDKTQRPKSRKECENQDCKAEWHTSDWGSCSSNCGTGGVQLRLLSCVWANSGAAAGRNCEGRRPPAARPCPNADSLPPCRPTALPLLQDESCEDNSRYCDIIKVFHSCDSNEVRQKCCATCKYMERRR
ncbi:unnamed protein product [Cylicocyclus nassatus]|uniref:Uncharacterized protein n=1 Tax=Cylicocyclus nassatus TaxID=53992 RepID=A0AA36DUL9_CYLNA|nr:unnamed protein product [Cylicocyclus nassatus]